MPEPRVKHQEEERRRECFGMEFMERDIAGGGRDQHGAGQEERCFPIEAEPLADAEGDWSHGSEGGVLHDDEEQGVVEDQEKRGNEENDRFDMISQEGNA